MDSSGFIILDKFTFLSERVDTLSCNPNFLDEVWLPINFSFFEFLFEFLLYLRCIWFVNGQIGESETLACSPECIVSFGVCSPECLVGKSSPECSVGNCSPECEISFGYVSVGSHSPEYPAGI